MVFLAVYWTIRYIVHHTTQTSKFNNVKQCPFIMHWIIHSHNAISFFFMCQRLKVKNFVPMYCRFNTEIRAVYTGTEKPEFFSHSGFSLEVARQIPLNTVKNRIEKPTSEVWFFETPPVFHWFFANVNARSPLTGIIRFLVTWDVTFCGITRSSLRTTYGQKSRMRTTYQKTSTCMIIGGFRACAFLAKKTKSYGFFLAV